MNPLALKETVEDGQRGMMRAGDIGAHKTNGENEGIQELTTQ